MSVGVPHPHRPSDRKSFLLLPYHNTIATIIAVGLSRIESLADLFALLRVDINEMGLLFCLSPDVPLLEKIKDLISSELNDINSYPMQPNPCK